MPGPRKKQADALTQNIKWLAETFGKERLGFLTLTLGDKDAGGYFRNLRDRKEAQRRFHSLLSNVIAKRYRCGVIITERHRNGGIHFHLGVVCDDDICGGMDFVACFPPKGPKGKRRINRTMQPRMMPSRASGSFGGVSPIIMALAVISYSPCGPMARLWDATWAST